jgi:hypothetical protein
MNVVEELVNLNKLNSMLAANHPLLYRAQPHVLILYAIANVIISLMGRVLVGYFPTYYGPIVTTCALVAVFLFVLWHVVTDEIPEVEGVLGFGYPLMCLTKLFGWLLLTFPMLFLVGFPVEEPWLVLYVLVFGIVIAARSYSLYFRVAESNSRLDVCFWIAAVVLYAASSAIFGVKYGLSFVVPLYVFSLGVLIVSTYWGKRTRMTWSLSRHAGVLPLVLAAGAMMSFAIEAWAESNRSEERLKEYLSKFEKEEMLTSEEINLRLYDYEERLRRIGRRTEAEKEAEKEKKKEMDDRKSIIEILSVLGLIAICAWLDLVRRLCERFRLLPFLNYSYSGHTAASIS